MTNENELEPYRPYFFSGLLISFIGVGIWALMQMDWLKFYPLETHGFLMIMGFLMAYISGFLMTAIPKMSASFGAGLGEIATGLMLLWAQVSVSLRNSFKAMLIVGMVQVLFLIFFVARRWRVRKAQPPRSLVFLPFALLSALLGCLLLFLSTTPDSLPSVFRDYGKLLVYQAFVLNLILGLGSRLIPALTRVKDSIDVRAGVQEPILPFVALAVALNLSFWLEAFVSFSAGNLLRFAVIATLAVWKFRIFAPRSSVGYLGTGIRLSVVFLASGFLAAAIQPMYGIHWLHLSFIGGFALLTFLISTRVVLAHGGYDLSMEIKTREIAWFFSILAIVAVLRSLLGVGGAFRNELIWAVVIGWIVGSMLWSRSFLGKLMNSQSTPQS